MFTRAILPFSVVFLIAGGEPTKDAEKESEKLQGEWKVVSMDLLGKELDADTIKKLKPLVVKGNKWTAPTGEKLSFKVDPTKKPKELDVVFNERTFRGIYKLEGDTLTFCRPASASAERPKEFKPGDKVALFVYKRSGK
jgi:uncharacterized protein (TIGR03067 family)